MTESYLRIIARTLNYLSRGGGRCSCRSLPTAPTAALAILTSRRLLSGSGYRGGATTVPS